LETPFDREAELSLGRLNELLAVRERQLLGDSTSRSHLILAVSRL